MAGFDKAALEWLRADKEVTLRTAKHPDTAVIIWVVVAADDAVYVRSVKGAQGRWYRDLTSDAHATLQVRQQVIQVQAIAAADDVSVGLASEAFRARDRVARMSALSCGLTSSRPLCVCNRCRTALLRIDCGQRL